MSSNGDIESCTASSPTSTENSLIPYDRSGLAGIFARSDGKPQTEYPKSPLPLWQASIPQRSDLRSSNRWALLDDDPAEDSEDDRPADEQASMPAGVPKRKKQKPRKRKGNVQAARSTAPSTSTSTALAIISAPQSEQSSASDSRSTKRSAYGTRAGASEPQVLTTGRNKFPPDALLAMIHQEEAGRSRKAERARQNQEQEWRTKIANAYYALELSIQNLETKGVKLDGTAVSEELRGRPSIRKLLKEASERASAYETITLDAFHWGEPHGINSQMWEYRACGSFVPVSEEGIEKSVVCLGNGTVSQGMTEPDEYCPLNNRSECTWDSICVHQMEWMAEKMNGLQSLQKNDS